MNIINLSNIISLDFRMSIINHFPDEYIDEIDEDLNNYFTPVWEEVLLQENITDLLDVGCGNGIFSSIVKKKKLDVNSLE